MQDEKQEISLLALSKLGALENNKALDYTLPLMLFAHRLSKLDFYENSIEQLREKFVNEILSINSKLTSLKIYDESEITRFRYCLCVFIDEILMRNDIFMNSYWANNTLTIRLFDEHFGGDKFFGIMDYWLSNPTQNRDMLEFVYVCLVMGYQGKFSSHQDSNEKIIYLCDNICSAITPSLDSSQSIAFNKAYNQIKKDSIINRILRYFLKPVLIATPIAIVVIVYCVAFYKINVSNDEMLSQSTQIIENYRGR